MVAHGDVVDGFRVVASVGRGGMGEVFLARRDGADESDRHVVLKVLHAHRADMASALLDELQVATRIAHPSVARVLGHGQHDGSPYLVVEYVHGCTLRQLFSALFEKGRRLSPPLAAYIAHELATGLHAAHEARNDGGALLGVVHRDVSPGNVMLSHVGEVKLIDFGVARFEGRAVVTAPGRVKGTPRYMAPEQLAGGAIDRRTDVFALAIVLSELLTMVRATWDGTKLVSPASLSDDVPEALSALVVGAASWEPAERPATAAAFAAAVAKCIALPAHGAQALARVVAETVPEVLAVRDRTVPAPLSRRLVADRARTIPPGEREPATLLARPSPGGERAENAWASASRSEDEPKETLAGKISARPPSGRSGRSPSERPSERSATTTAPRAVPITTDLDTKARRAARLGAMLWALLAVSAFTIAFGAVTLLWP